MNRPADEEDIEKYCLHHELARPKIHYNKVSAVTCVALLCTVLCSYTLCRLTGLNFWVWLDICMALTVICHAKDILVFLVKCYQHFAPEDVRRQCSCKPSCSEYALLALDRYLWPKAVWKIWRRVTHTCAQQGYHIDYP